MSKRLLHVSSVFLVPRGALVLLLAAIVGACGGAAEAVVGQTSSRVSASGEGPSGNPAPGQTACDSASGRVLEVGPGKAYAAPSAAAAAARSGDVVRIAAGDYRGDVATWSASNLTLCGSGGRARLFADGRSAGGKAIWVVSGANITIDSVEFHNAAVPDRNGAGIRAEHRSGDLRIVNSGFFDNENGILSAAGPVTLTIERSEFARNGFGDGQSHNLYANNIARLTVLASHFHEAKIGHNLKSRAAQSVIENSYFMDGPNGTASYQMDFPNGGDVLLRGNLVQKGPKADNANGIAFGLEGLTQPVNRLALVHNTLVSTRSGGAFLSVAALAQSVRLTANLLAGTGNQALITSGFAPGNVVRSGDVNSLASNLLGPTNIAAPNFWPNATLQGLIGLPGAADAGYLSEAPQPFTLRTLAGSARLAGALQSAP
jgi:hypothetical protein